ncbi:MAG: LytTR family DNA-binding domain-containing protein [Nannocystaceae bacterium]
MTTTVVVLEDEAPARERLVAALHEADASLQVVAALASVREAVAWLQEHGAPDLVFADVMLSDGLSFEVFETVQLHCPVVFCTAYDEYLVEAMAAQGIAYLLKPFEVADVAEALGRYRRLAAHFHRRFDGLRAAMRPGRRRILARAADGGLLAVALPEVAYFAVRDGLTVVVDKVGRCLEVDRTLTELEAELPGADWFRVNRQYLVHADAVVGFAPFLKGRLLVRLRPEAGEEVVVSQPNAARFRGWLEG